MKYRLFFLLVLVISYLFLATKSRFNEPVPKIIHQTAPADKAKWHPIWEKCQQSWKEKFPDFEYIMWTDEDLDNLVKTKYSWFHDIYQAYDVNIKRFDAARYFILHEYGGIYADMDYECIQNFWDQIPKDKVSIASVENALMVSPPRDPFWLILFSKLRDKMNEHTFHATGPSVLEEVKKQSKDKYNQLEQKDYHSKDGKYAIHHGTFSWLDNTNKSTTNNW